MNSMTRHQKNDIRLLGKFVEVYCQGNHPDKPKEPVLLPEQLGSRTLCPECGTFLRYAITKRLKCPLEAEKPTCKHCRIHCYAQEHRDKVRKIMAYAGKRLLLKGRLDYLWHYFF